jgi:hypothetical protein
MNMKGRPPYDVTLLVEKYRNLRNKGLRKEHCLGDKARFKSYLLRVATTDGLRKAYFVGEPYSKTPRRNNSCGGLQVNTVGIWT